MSYTAPIAEMAFCAEHITGQGALAGTERFAEATAETRAAILEEAAKLCEGELAPLNRVSDLQPAVLENGVVRCTPGFREAYARIAEGGWVGMSADPAHGGMGLPQSLTVMVGEMLASSCLSLSLNPLMTQGQIEALEHHADGWIRDLYIPKLVSGEWTGNDEPDRAAGRVGCRRAQHPGRAEGGWQPCGHRPEDLHLLGRP